VKIEQSIAIMKALADKSRLAMINSLLEQPQYAEELAKRHALAPSTVSFHLRKLEQAGLVSSRKEQYYLVIEANKEVFDTTLRQIVSAPHAGKELQDERMDLYRRKVLETFFCNGSLEKLPTQHKKRLIVLEQFALRFERGRRYSESEVTALINPLFDDYCIIRRLLVDEGLVSREGSIYWRDQKPAAEADRQVLPTGAGTMKKDGRRAEIKRIYKQSGAEMGIYPILNKANGRIYIGSSKNLEGTRNSRLFQLKMGKVVFSAHLQKDLDEFGAESFEFSVLAVLDPTEPGDNVDRLLAALELHWLEKLQPFGERGYNSLKGFQRATGQLKNQVEANLIH
jgi:hypothetical protein